MANFGNDLRHSVRTLIANPGFSIMTILMLALGIGACTAIFTVMNAVLLRPLLYPDPNSLVQLWELSDKARPMRLPEANVLDWKSQSRSFQGMAMFGASVQPIVGGSEPVRGAAHGGVGRHDRRRADRSRAPALDADRRRRLRARVG